MAVHSSPTTILSLPTHNMNFGKQQPTCSRSAMITTDRSPLVAQLPQLTNNRIKPVPSKSCQTSNTHQTLTSNYLRRRSLVKVMPSLSKKTNDKNDTFQQQRNSVTDSTTTKTSNHRQKITNVNTRVAPSIPKNGNKNDQTPSSMNNGISTTPRQNTTGISRRLSLMKTPGRPSTTTNIHTTSGSDDEKNTTRNTNKHGSVLNPTVPTAEAAVPASVQKQKQKQQQNRLSRGTSSSLAAGPQQALPQHRRLSSTLSSAGIVKQNKTETLTHLPSLTKLQNAKKTPLGPRPAGSITSDSGSDGDHAAVAATTTMDNHMKQQQQQQHRAQHSQSPTTFRRTNDPLLQYQQQRRTSIISLSPLPHPNKVSSSSSSTLVRRRSFADISPRSSLVPSASSTLSQHHHHHHHHQQQQQQQQQSDQENKQQNQQTLRNSQSHLRHPSWLDSAGFMRPSKCSICHPPPPKKSVITPPVGMGVPKFGLPPPDMSPSGNSNGAALPPPTTTTASTISTNTPKYGLERRPSSRNSLVNEKLGKHMHTFCPSSSTVAQKNTTTISSMDGVARMNQRRRMSLPNTANAAMDYSKTATTTATKRKTGLEKRPSFYTTNNSNVSKGTVTSTVNHNTTRRSSNKRIVAPKTKIAKQQPSPDTPILDKDFAHSPSSSSSFTEANTDTNTNTNTTSSTSSPTTADDESRPSTPTDMKHQQVTQLMESDYLKTFVDDSGDKDGYSEAAHDILTEPGMAKLQTSPPVVTNDDSITQRDNKNGDLIQHRLGDAFEQLQTFLDLSPTTAATPDTYTKEQHHHHHQIDFEIAPPSSLMSEDTSDAAQCTSSYSSSTTSASSLSEMSLRLQNSSPTNAVHQLSTTVSLVSPQSPTPLQLPPPPPSSSVLSELEQWTDMVRLTLGRWFTDLNHGHLEHYEKDADGSVTTMTITGFVVTMETDLVHPLSSSSLAEKIHQHRYTMCLGPEERQQTFTTLSSSSDSWIPDDQVDQCQFKYKSTQCESEFDWMNRRHHCRRCGHIFCKTHSSNRLPLFTKNYPNQIKWSRVCDSCCYDLVGASLMEI